MLTRPELWIERCSKRLRELLPALSQQDAEDIAQYLWNDGKWARDPELVAEEHAKDDQP